MVRRISDVDWRTWKADDPATLVFVVREGQVLLIRKKRGLGAGKINGPGGRLEPGESPLECPTGLTMCGENSFQFVDGYSTHVYVFRATGCDAEPEETEEATPIWAPIERIPYQQMWEDDELWLPLVLRGGQFSGRFIFDGDTMLDFQLDEGP
jgi:8-oxo-dGTP diphosphatase